MDHTRSSTDGLDAADRRAVRILGQYSGWHDNRQHLWELEPDMRSWTRMFGTLAVVLLVPAILFALLLGIEIFSQNAAAVLGLLATLWFVLRYIQYLPLLLWGTKTNRATVNVGFHMRPALATAALGGWTFLLMTPEFGVREGLTNETIGATQWLQFFAAQIVNLFSSDIPQLVGWTTLPIAPQTLIARAALALWRLLFAAGIVELALLVYSRTRDRKLFYGTLRDCWEQCAIEPNQQLKVRHLGTVEPLPVIHRCSVSDIRIGLLLDEHLNAISAGQIMRRRETEEV